MNTTTVTTSNDLEIRVERIFDVPRAHVFSVWTNPKLIPEWWGDGTVVEDLGDTTMQYGVEEGAKSGFARVDALLQRLPPDA